MHSNGLGNRNRHRAGRYRLLLFTMLAMVCLALVIWLLWSREEKAENRKNLLPGHTDSVALHRQELP